MVRGRRARLRLVQTDFSNVQIWDDVRISGRIFHQKGCNMKSLKKFINKIPKLKVYVERKIPEGKTFKDLIEATSKMTCREKLALEHII